MSPEEREWLKQFALALEGDYNTLPLRLPPRIRDFLMQRLVADRMIRAIDVQREPLRAHIAGLVGEG